MNLPEPPNWAVRFLRWYCKPQFLEEIEGDIFELFDRRVESEGLKIARRKFGWDVFRFFRWSNIKRSNSNKMNQLGLFSNYLKFGFRSIQRNVLISAINIFGLAIAIGVALTTFIFIDLQLNFNEFLDNRDRIYQVINRVQEEGQDRIWADSPLFLGSRLMEDHPSVAATVRIENMGGSVRYQDKVLNERLVFVDNTFLDVFDFPVLEGNPDALKDNDRIVISQQIAEKYFDDISAVGKDVEIKFQNNNVKRFTVGAVLQAYPYNSSFKFGIMLPFESIYTIGLKANKHDLGDMIDATFVLLHEGQNIDNIRTSYESYMTDYNGSDPEWKILNFQEMALSDIPIKGGNIYSSIIPTTTPETLITLGVIALLLLGMASFNFMNISITGISKRLKEIGIRKVMGGVRGQIIYQFIIENILLTMIALMAGTLISYFLITPGFDALVIGLDINFRTNEWESMILFYGIMLLGISLSSGAYPAFYVSKFEPVSVLKGTSKLKGKNLFSKILLGFQFFMAFITIVGCFVFTDQSLYLMNKEWGYDPEDVMFVRVRDQETYERLRNELIGHDNVLALAGATGQVGWSNPKESFEMLEQQFAIRAYGVTQSYAEILGLSLKEGRFLSDREEDQQFSVVINETFVERMGWEDTIGKTIPFRGQNKTVVGVVHDFYYTEYYELIDPIIIYGLSDEEVRYFSVKTKPGRMEEVDLQMRELWLEINPNDMYGRNLQSQVFDDFYRETSANIAIVVFLSSIAIILACLGLYGLIAFHIQAKLKEFSVRKVLGATPGSIARIASQQYSWIILSAFVIGAPLGALGILQLIKGIFPDPKPVAALPFIAALVIVIITLLLTVTGQVRRAINVNPATILRNE